MKMKSFGPVVRHYKSAIGLVVCLRLSTWSRWNMRKRHKFVTTFFTNWRKNLCGSFSITIFRKVSGFCRATQSSAKQQSEQNSQKFIVMGYIKLGGDLAALRNLKISKGWLISGDRSGPSFDVFEGSSSSRLIKREASSRYLSEHLTN